MIVSKAADNLVKVEGIKAAFTVLRVGDSVKISARSGGEINVQLIMEEIGGGGHFEGAAAQIADTSAEDVLVRLKAAIDKAIEKIN